MRLRRRYHAPWGSGSECSDIQGLRQIHRKPALSTTGPAPAISGRTKPFPVDERNDGSQKGKELIEKLFPNHAKNFEEYFKVLDDEETDTLFKILRKLHKSL